MTKAISIFIYDKEVYKIAIKRWRIAEYDAIRRLDTAFFLRVTY